MTVKLTIKDAWEDLWKIQSTARESGKIPIKISCSKSVFFNFILKERTHDGEYAFRPIDWSYHGIRCEVNDELQDGEVEIHFRKEGSYNELLRPSLRYGTIFQST